MQNFSTIHLIVRGASQKNLRGVDTTPPLGVLGLTEIIIEPQPVTVPLFHIKVKKAGHSGTFFNY